MSEFIDPSTPSPWMTGEASDRDVVLSSRVRFARNLEEFPFDTRATSQEKEEIREDVHDVLAQKQFPHDWNSWQVQDLDGVKNRFLVERRLASEELTEDPYGGLFHTDDESVSVMVNEEDHVRIQSFRAGNHINDAFDRAHKIERALDKHLPFAFHEQWGFLTSCPTNVGTGLRASLLVHLPGLVMTGKIDRVLKAVSNLGLTVRGFAGEGSESRGFYFQLSNQVTLGQSAEEMRDNLQRVSQKIVEQEREARQSLVSSSNVDVLDQIWRSYGICKYAQKIKTTEALETLSYCRLGVDLGLIDVTSLETIDGLLLLIQPAHLMLHVKDQLKSGERDFYRARRIRKVMSDSDPTDSNYDEGPDSSESNTHSRES